MNKVILVGRLTRDPEVRYAEQGEKTCIHKIYAGSGAEDQKGTGTNSRFYFLRCIPASGGICCKLFPAGDADRSFRANPDRELCEPGGDRIYTTDVIIEEQEFAESRQEQEQSRQSAAPTEAESEEAAFHG